MVSFVFNGIIVLATLGIIIDFTIYLMQKITQLTPEQEALIPDYIDRWTKIAFSCEPTNKLEIIPAIEEIYSLLNLPKPIVYFCDRPTSKREVLVDLSLDDFGWSIKSQVDELIVDNIEQQIKLNMTDDLWEHLDENDILRVKNFHGKKIWSCSSTQIDYYDGFYFDDIAFFEGNFPHTLIYIGLRFDYYRNLFDPESDFIQKIWRILLSIVHNCSQIFFFENICIVYEKLKLLSLDNDGYLHNDGKPAVRFKNGTVYYAFHGEVIDPKYGQVHSNEWKTEWLLEVNNEDDKKIFRDNTLRNILISGIGEDKIARELKDKKIINKLGVLTPEQKSLIPKYKSKWRKIATSTARCDRDLVTHYIHRAYSYLEVEQTEVIFFDSPIQAQQYALDNRLKAHLKKLFADNICQYSYLHHIDRRIVDKLKSEILLHQTDRDIYQIHNYRHITNPVVDRIRQKFQQVIKCIKPESYIVDATIQDYLLSNFDCQEETARMEIFTGLISNCGWIYPYGEACLVSQRPISLHLDREYFLYAENKPAIEYADGLSIYSHDLEKR